MLAPAGIQTVKLPSFREWDQYRWAKGLIVNHQVRLGFWLSLNRVSERFKTGSIKAVNVERRFGNVHGGLGVVI
jgi:hypothetical protein